jgi:hypothetical protein
MLFQRRLCQWKTGSTGLALYARAGIRAQFAYSCVLHHAARGTARTGLGTLGTAPSNWRAHVGRDHRWRAPRRL